MDHPRRSGILLHPTSLPGHQAIGTLGQEAFEFIDFLAASGQSIWQILPLGPTGYGNCPYSSYSAFAGNPLLINLAKLAATGDLPEDLLPPVSAASERCDIVLAADQQLPLLGKAWQGFRDNASPERRQAFEEFCLQQAAWLNDYALFEALRQELGDKNWQKWPSELRCREENALQAWAENRQEVIGWHRYLQFIFFEQWFALKEYANRKGISIFGDLPIFVAENSADVWANQQFFFLDEEGRPTLVAGVPPDYFSKTGQRWGNPLYRWEQLAASDYSWWLQRFDWNLRLFDLVRVDHFRGFAACWAIPAEEPTAVNGSWMPVPGRELFNSLQDRASQLPIIAEDLGVITPDVEELRDQFGLPGMKILQFAFDSGPGNPYLPHNHLPNCVVYTGTHDNNTSLGWWNSLAEENRQQVRNYLKRPCDEMPWTLIETALASVACLAIIPLQDILSLGGQARMNRPGTATGNWCWRLLPDFNTQKIIIRLQEVTHLYGRALCNPAEMH